MIILGKNIVGEIISIKLSIPSNTEVSQYYYLIELYFPVY